MICYSRVICVFHRLKPMRTGLSFFRSAFRIVTTTGRAVAILTPGTRASDQPVSDSDTCFPFWEGAIADFLRKTSLFCRACLHRTAKQARLLQSRREASAARAFPIEIDFPPARDASETLFQSFRESECPWWDNGWRTGAFRSDTFLNARLHDGLSDPYNVTHLEPAKYEGLPWNFTNFHSLDMTLGVRKNGLDRDPEMWLEDTTYRGSHVSKTRRDGGVSCPDIMSHHDSYRMKTDTKSLEVYD